MNLAGVMGILGVVPQLPAHIPGEQIPVTSVTVCGAAQARRGLSALIFLGERFCCISAKSGNIPLRPGGGVGAQ